VLAVGAPVVLLEIEVHRVAFERGPALAMACTALTAALRPLLLASVDCR